MEYGGHFDAADEVIIMQGGKCFRTLPQLKIAIINPRETRGTRETRGMR